MHTIHFYENYTVYTLFQVDMSSEIREEKAASNILEDEPEMSIEIRPEEESLASLSGCLCSTQHMNSELFDRDSQPTVSIFGTVYGYLQKKPTLIESVMQCLTCTVGRYRRYCT